MSDVRKIYLILFWVGLVLFGLVLSFLEYVRSAEGIPDTILGWFGVLLGLLFFVEDVRCAEGMPGTILIEFGLFGLCYVLIEVVRCAEGVPGNIGRNYCNVYWLRVYFTAPITD